MKKITVIGGGTGTFVVLSGLKKYNVDLSVIVSMMDSGGSTGKLRDQLGVLPPGDVRQCLVALSEAPLFWRKLFLYRFDSGDLKGHNFGNILLSTLEKISPNYQQVINKASFILKCKGNVYPITFEKSNLCVQYDDGEIIEGEGLIDKATHKTVKIKKCYLSPKPVINPLAVKSIEQSKYLVIGPGDLYTSLIPNLIVPGMKEAIKTSKAKVIYIMNLMTKPGQTNSYNASNHIEDLEKYLGRSIDYVLMNNKRIPQSVIEHYKQELEEPVIDDLGTVGNVLRLDLLSKTVYNKTSNDTAERSLIRHDSLKIAKAITELINTKVL
ncbi:MAG TPA: gluconeogenesis factor YvcK family protein [Candidatus Nitrosocosmicus sp.]|nr:gluconeogenesis factor YvcK family protein [Candidatus Nitrosocosmicus sp.]